MEEKLNVETEIFELENKINELEDRPDCTNIRNKIYKKDITAVELIILLRDLNLITSDYACTLSRFIIEYDLNEDIDRIKRLQAINIMGASKVFENFKFRCECNEEAVKVIIQSIKLDNFYQTRPIYPWEDKSR